MQVRSMTEKEEGKGEAKGKVESGKVLGKVRARECETLAGSCERLVCWKVCY